MMMILFPSQGESRRARGTRVLFPAPGGAWSINVAFELSEDLSSLKTSFIGKSLAKEISDLIL